MKLVEVSRRQLSESFSVLKLWKNFAYASKTAAMEFFRIAEISCDEAMLQSRLSTQNIEQWCESIFAIGEEQDECTIGSNWGEFQLRRDRIKGGVRFAMLDCPNALAWTITTGYPPKKDAIVVHLTINRTEKDSDFIEEVEALLEEVEDGLRNHLQPSI